MAVQKQDDQHEHTFSNYVRIQDVVQKICRRRWTIGKSGERGSGISVLPARHDDDDDIYNTKNKLADRCRERPEGSIFKPRYREGRNSFSCIVPLTLDLNLIMLSIKQGGIKYHFWVFGYDSTWDWTLISQTISNHFNPYTMILKKGSGPMLIMSRKLNKK